MAGLRGDFDDIAVAQAVPQRDDAAVHLCGGRRVAHVGVDGVGEVDRGGVLGQHDDFALGGEGVDLLRVQVDLEGRHELVGVGHFALPLHQLPHPGEALLVLGADGFVGLVLPVGGDAVLCDAVHLFRANLHFELVAAFGHERGVQGLVAVGPRHGDEVFNTSGDGTPQVLHEAEQGVAVLHGLRDDANGVQVVNLGDIDLRTGGGRRQLLLDGVKTLGTELHAAGQAMARQFTFQLADDGDQELFAAALSQLFHFCG